MFVAIDVDLSQSLACATVATNKSYNIINVV